MLSRYLEILRDVYDAGETRAVFYRLVEDRFGLSRTDVCLGALNNLTEEQKTLLDTDLKRLAEGEPVQYVVGYEKFRNITLHVEPGVLIPRPETEELVDWIMKDVRNLRPHASRSEMNVTFPSILDIGCGSGAIAVSLALELKADVTAWDVSETALRVTRDNARARFASVNVVRQDALQPPVSDTALWDVIVSNPPYVCDSESAAMQPQVKDHEPHLALFVPDADPLLFYRAIATYAVHALKPSGSLYFEINERFGEETIALLRSLGFADITLRQDQFGKARMIRAILP